ncbi:MAG: hypothetical protein WC763_06710 [Candidatus Paceibacterota bacterium]|jgi:hypothetical protein
MSSPDDQTTENNEDANRPPSKSIGLQLLEFAHAQFVIPPYMIDSTTPRGERLLIPSLVDVLHYGKARQDEMLRYDYDDGKASDNVRLASLTGGSCELTWDSQQQQSSHPPTRWHSIYALILSRSDTAAAAAAADTTDSMSLWRHLFLGRFSIEDWFLRCLSYRIHVLLKGMDGVLEVGKYRKQRRHEKPIKFDLYVDESKEPSFLIDHPHASAFNVTFQRPFAWKWK